MSQARTRSLPHARRPTSGRYAFRALAARAHAATMVAHTHVRAAGRSTMVVQGRAVSLGISKSSPQDAVAPASELALSPRAWRAGSHGVCRNSGLAALPGVEVGAPRWWCSPTAATMVARPRSASPPAPLAARSHRRQRDQHRNQSVKRAEVRVLAGGARRCRRRWRGSGGARVEKRESAEHHPPFPPGAQGC